MRKWLLTVLLLGLVLLCGCGKTEQYDVIVVGGDPEGISAAVTAARNGMKTLLIEDDEALGGLMTLGGLNFIDMCNGRDGTLLTRGTFEEFYNAVGGTAFDISTAKDVFLQMVNAEENLTLKLNTQLKSVLVKDDVVSGVVVLQDGKSITCKANSVIDATQDADVAAAAGVPYTVLGEDYGKTELSTGVTLVFELSGVDWHEVAEYLRNDGNPNTGVTDKAAWGFNEQGAAYMPRNSQMRLRGLNLARQNDGNVLVNGFIILGVDPLSGSEGRASIMQEGKAELEQVVPYLQQNYPGFANAQLVDTAEQLYVRESRHILGEYQLTLEDVLENRWFDDTIAIGSYPVDVPPNQDLQIGVIIGNPDRYGVPFRCLVPQQVDGLLVVGRSAAYQSLAAGSARVIPLGMAEGDAAGVAAAYATEHQLTFRQISQDTAAVADIQQTLKAQGAYLEQWEPIEEAVEQHWAYPGVQVMRDLGVLYGGYSNDYRLEDAITRDEFLPMLQTLAETVVSSPNDTILEEQEESLTCGEIVYMVENTLQLRPNGTTLQDIDVLTEQLQPYFAEVDKVPNRAEVVMLLANAYQYQQQRAAESNE